MAFFLAFLLAGALTCPGCVSQQRTASERWALATLTFTSAQDGLLLARRAGRVSDEDMLAADVWVRAARTALDRAQARLPDDAGAAAGLLDLAAAAIREIEKIEAAVAPESEVRDGPG